MEAVTPLLIRGLESLGLSPSDRMVSLFTTYLAELKRWGRAYNLTALRADEEIVSKHFIDSLLYLSLIPPGSRDLCDVGSGAGFPGLPLAIARPELRVTLVEPSRKKSAFLRHMVRRLGLENAAVLHGRAEEVDQAFDVVVTRALFTIGDLLRKTGRLVREGGFLVLSKGPGFREEIEALPKGLRVEVKEVRLPGSPLCRFLVRVSPGPPQSAVSESSACSSEAGHGAGETVGSHEPPTVKDPGLTTQDSRLGS